MKPNHHWVTHIFDQLLDYGPVYGFWAFPVERMNRVLCLTNINNRENGEIESTFMSEFERFTILRQLATDLSRRGDEHAFVGEELLASDRDERGTLAALAREVEEGAADRKSSSSYFIFEI